MIISELKTGNYVKLNRVNFEDFEDADLNRELSNKVFTIKEINKENGDVCLVSDSGEAITVKVDLLKPIKIDSDILKRLSQFKHIGDLNLPTLDLYVCNSIINKPINLRIEKHSDTFLSKIEIDCIEIQYLHELQNIFKSISGEDLILK